MKKLGVLFIFVFIFSGCNWLQAPAEDPIIVDDPVLEEDVMEEDVMEEVEDVVEDASANSESKEIILAKCLKENGAKLYAAEWCGHCKKQKAAFGDGLEYLDFTECAEGDDWAQDCKDADITSVPTWIFADGTRQSGNTALDKLASLSGCTY